MRRVSGATPHKIFVHNRTNLYLKPTHFSAQCMKRCLFFTRRSPDTRTCETAKTESDTAGQHRKHRHLFAVAIFYMLTQVRKRELPTPRALPCSSDKYVISVLPSVCVTEGLSLCQISAQGTISSSGVITWLDIADHRQ
jgi:hypothetical protein